MKNCKLSVSVVMPVFNMSRVLVRAVSSVLNQTVTDFELIIVNDGSTDDTLPELRRFMDERIVVINQPNCGVSVARNRGIESARSDHVCLIDADDEWDSDLLDILLRLKDSFPQAALFASGYRYRDPDGIISFPILRGLPCSGFRGIVEDYFSIAAVSDPPFWTSAIMLKRIALKSVGMFPPGVTSGEDLLTWARLAACYPVAIDTTAHATYHLSAKMSDHPTRVPQLSDPVGRGLSDLLKEIPSPGKRKSLRRYISVWYKSRASMYLRLGMRRQGAYNIVRMGFYWLNLKFLQYCGAMIIPQNTLLRLLHIRGKRGSP